MSQPDRRLHESEPCDDRIGDGDDAEGEGNDVGEEKRRKGQRSGVSLISRDFRNVIKRPFRKRRTRRNEEETERGDDEVVKLPLKVVERRGRRRRRRKSVGGGGGCYVCFMLPRAEDSSPETPTSDPNSESFSFEMLRTLIEKNDFYCKECNTYV